MGCFLACFGSSKDKKRRNQRYRVQHQRDHRCTSFEPVQSDVSSIPEEVREKPIIPALEEVRDDKPLEQVSLSTRKKVTFDSNVRTYEHVSPNEETSDPLLGSEESGKKKAEEEEGKILEKPCQSKSSSEDSSITSSSGSSYPPNHRYQNCRDNDDEDEPLDYVDSDLDDEDDGDDYDDDDGELEYEDEIVQSNKWVSTPQGITEDFDSPMLIKPTGGLNHNARDRSSYVHSVLNPVENLTQWKAVKAKGTSLMKPQKENFTLDQEPRILFSTEPTLSFKSKADQDKKNLRNPNQEMAVDASLSNWLVSSEHTPVNKTSTVALDTFTLEKSVSYGSSPMRSQEDRPILGALTVEEIRQFSATSSPKKSPSRSPDETPIIGTVGTYWNHTASPPAKGSSGASFYKGIPNTTSKYRRVHVM